MFVCVYIDFIVGQSFQYLFAFGACCFGGKHFSDRRKLYFIFLLNTFKNTLMAIIVFVYIYFWKRYVIVSSETFKLFKMYGKLKENKPFEIFPQPGTQTRVL